MCKISISYRRLKCLRYYDREIRWCREALDHGDLVCEASVEEWLHAAREHVPPEDLDRAMRAVENTRQLLRARAAYATQERDTLLAWIAAIPKDDVRAAMYLHYVKGYRFREIAEQYFGGTVTTDAVKRMCGRWLHGKHTGKRGWPEGEVYNDVGTAEKPPGD